MEFGQETPDAGALMARVEELIDQGRPGAARPILAAVRGLVQSSARLSLLAARLSLSDGKLDGTGEELDAALRADPDHSGLHKCRAELRHRLGDLDGATRDAAEAVSLDRNDPAAKAQLGQLLFELGRVADAIPCLIEAVHAKPDDPSYRETLAHALIAAGDLDGAMATLLEGIAAAPGVIAIRNAAILLCIRRRDFAQADRLAAQSRVDGVADASTFGLQGHALSSLSRHEDAALAYEEALKLAPGDPTVRQLAAAAGIAASAPRTPDDTVRTLFDGSADAFEAHLISLGYRIPGLIRRHAVAFLEETEIGPVLDLGCGTGLVVLALADLNLGPFTGIDLSPRMLDQARAKQIYATLREAALPAALADDPDRWNLIVAADLLCYFGALEEIFAAVRARLAPGGRFIFSVEELLPDHDNNLPGNGDWALGRMGRYGHSRSCVARTAESVGFRCLTLDAETLRHEAGGPVAGMIAVLERPRDDA
jgi:predicted TPR repeat methyltransferase/thioredoxin-like negative regulator of GroEL